MNSEIIPQRLLTEFTSSGMTIFITKALTYLQQRSLQDKIDCTERNSTKQYVASYIFM